MKFLKDEKGGYYEIFPLAATFFFNIATRWLVATAYSALSKRYSKAARVF